MLYNTADELLNLVVDQGVRYTELEYINALSLLHRSQTGVGDLSTQNIRLQRLKEIICEQAAIKQASKDKKITTVWWYHQICHMGVKCLIGWLIIKDSTGKSAFHNTIVSVFLLHAVCFSFYIVFLLFAFASSWLVLKPLSSPQRRDASSPYSLPRSHLICIPPLWELKKKPNATPNPPLLTVTSGQRQGRSPKLGRHLIFLLEPHSSSQLHLHLSPFSSPTGQLIHSAITDARLGCERGHILGLLPIWRAP